MAESGFRDEAQQQLVNEQDHLLAETRHEDLTNEYGRLQLENEDLVRTLRRGDSHFNPRLDGALFKSIHQLHERNTILVGLIADKTIPELQAAIAELQAAIAELQANNVELMEKNKLLSQSIQQMAATMNQLDLERSMLTTALAARQLATAFEQNLVHYVMGKDLPKPSAQPFCIKSYNSCFKFLSAWEVYVSAETEGSDVAKRVKFNKDASVICYGKAAVDAFLALPIDQQEAALARLNLVEGLQSQVVYNFNCVNDLGHGAAHRKVGDHSWDEVVEALQANGYEDESRALSELHQLMKDPNLAGVQPVEMDPCWVIA
jgi:hypothetical protein